MRLLKSWVCRSRLSSLPPTHTRTRTHSLLHLRTAHSRPLTLPPDKKYGPITLPIFISVDPARDPPCQIAQYLKDFHPRLVGLSGTYEQTRAVCKAYRVYFSTPKDAAPDGDYLVDHSIYFYLMDPEGNFVEALGRQHSPDQAAKVILDHMKDWQGGWRK